MAVADVKKFLSENVRNSDGKPLREFILACNFEGEDHGVTHIIPETNLAMAENTIAELLKMIHDQDPDGFDGIAERYKEITGSELELCDHRDMKEL